MPYDPLHRSAEQRAVLDAILGRAEAHGRQGVAVLDLDGTLFDTRPRQMAILRKYALQHHFPALLRVKEAHFIDWSLSRTLSNAGIKKALIEAHRAPLLRFWEQRFFNGAWLHHDRPMPGAPEMTRALADHGSSIVYLTGRHLPMREGTLSALRRGGFPWGHGQHLLLKPKFYDEDTEFKDRALEHIASLGRPTLFLDNEPANVNLFHQRHPDAMVVYVETDHSFRPIEADPSLPRIRGFLR